MSSKVEKDKQKQIQDRCQSLLNQMLKDDDNKYCVDCDSKGEFYLYLGIFQNDLLNIMFFDIRRSQMGFMEFRHILMHKVCRHSS